MKTVSRQRGWSLLSVALVLLVAGVFVLVVLRFYPGYYEAFNVRKALESLKENSDVGNMSKVAIWESLEKHFDISGMYNPSPKRENLRVEFDKKSGRKLIALDYEYRTHIMFNVDAVLVFNNQIEVDAP